MGSAELPLERGAAWSAIPKEARCPVAAADRRGDVGTVEQLHLAGMPGHEGGVYQRDQRHASKREILPVAAGPVLGYPMRLAGRSRQPGPAPGPQREGEGEAWATLPRRELNQGRRVSRRKQRRKLIAHPPYPLYWTVV
jgi:hypothetical protein